MTRNDCRSSRPAPFRRTPLLLLAAALALTAAAAGGEPPEPVPMVGSAACLDCHQDLAVQFTRSVHARLAEFEVHGGTRGCEACHGPGGRHVETMDPADIFTFSEASDSRAEDACLACHRNRVGVHWISSRHALSGVSCTSCHQIHQSRQTLPLEPGFQEKPLRVADLERQAPPLRASLKKPESLLCVECHRDVGARMMLPSRHPVREGKMQCSSCHQMHGAEWGMLRTDERVNDLCTECHASKQGPFVFEHQPVAENCATCHVPHGSVADNLLKQNQPFVCLQCHEAHFHIGREGLSTPNFVATGGSLNPFGSAGWRMAFGTSCSQCHQYVHGTDLPSQSLTSLGGSLTR